MDAMDRYRLCNPTEEYRDRVERASALVRRMDDLNRKYGPLILDSSARRAALPYLILDGPDGLDGVPLGEALKRACRLDMDRARLVYGSLDLYNKLVGEYSAGFDAVVGTLTPDDEIPEGFDDKDRYRDTERWCASIRDLLLADDYSDPPELYFLNFCWRLHDGTGDGPEWDGGSLIVSRRELREAIAAVEAEGPDGFAAAAR